MSDNSKISWTDATWNAVIGCDRVSPGCLNCYAVPTVNRGMSEQHRGVTVKLRNGKLDWNGLINLVPTRMFVPTRWTRPRRIFPNSLSDLWHANVPPEYVAAMYGVMIAAGQHVFQILTKRPERAAAWYRWVEAQPGGPVAYCLAQAVLVEEQLKKSHPGESYRFASHHMKRAPMHWPPDNVELGVTAEDQQRANERIPMLLTITAARHWVSYEPALELVTFAPWLSTVAEFDRALDNALGMITGVEADDALVRFVRSRGIAPENRKLAWVVVGGESGDGAREFDVDWGRRVMHECLTNNVPVFFKQAGARPVDSTLTDIIGPDGSVHYTRPPGEAKEMLTAGGEHHGYSLRPHALRLRDSKGGDLLELPEELRVQDFPSTLAA